MNLHRPSESHLATGASGGGTRPGTSGPKDGTPSKASPSPETGGAPATAAPAPAPETAPRPSRTPPRPPSPPEPPAGPGQAAPAPAPAPAPSAPPATHDGAPARHHSAPAPGRTPAVDGERLGRRMDRAVSGFVDDPRRAVRDADAVLDDAAALVEQRREELRQCWDGEGDGTADTEELRLALARYRDLTRGLIALTAAS
ncbi:hypothetical protein [Streptomyces sp. NPDC020917]|uniref:hypothetical protein n=1 Tax=Streptomyces sp. NPDC020917 TaxID=3365102 RepID=UPI0037902929